MTHPKQLHIVAKKNRAALKVVGCLALFLSLSCSRDGTSTPDDQLQLGSSLLDPKISTPKPQSQALVTPEGVLKQAELSMMILARNLNNSKNITEYRGFGPFDLYALVAYDEAVVQYSQNNWPAVVKNLNDYLNRTQVTDPPKYLESQWMLAKSYEQSGHKAKSLRAYLRYINYFFQIGHKDYGRLTQGIRSSLDLIDVLPSSQLNLDSLMAGLSLFKLPDEPLVAITMLLAKEASQKGNHHVSQTLAKMLESRFGDNPPKKVSHEIAYMRALNYVSQNRVELALKFLEFLAKNSTDDNIKDHAHYLLARIYLSNKKWKTALQHYQQIPEKSTFYQKSVFDSILVHLKLDQDKEARTLTTLWLSRWPDDIQSNSLKLNLAYLDLRSSEFELAENNINSLDTRLHELKNSIKNSLLHPESLDKSQLFQFKALSMGIIEKQFVLEESASLLSDLNNLRKSIFERYAEIKDLHQSLTQSSVNRIFPDLSNRTFQLAFFGQNLLDLAAELVSAQLELAEKTADSVDLEKLKFHTEKRQIIASEILNFHRNIKSNLVTSQYMALIASTNDLKRRIFMMESELKGTYVYGYQKKQSPIQNQSKELLAKTEALKKQLALRLSQIRALQFKEILIRSEVYSLEKSMTQQMLVINDQIDLMTKMLASVKDPNQKATVTKSLELWIQWKSLAKMYFEQIDGVKKLHQNKVGTLLSTIDKLENDTIKADYDAIYLSERVVNNIKKHSPQIVENLFAVIDSHLAKHQVWLSEIEWMKFDDRSKNRQRMRQKNLLEQQILENQFNSDLFTINNFN